MDDLFSYDESLGVGWIGFSHLILVFSISENKSEQSLVEVKTKSKMRKV